MGASGRPAEIGAGPPLLRNLPALTRELVPAAAFSAGPFHRRTADTKHIPPGDLPLHTGDWRGLRLRRSLYEIYCISYVTPYGSQAHFLLDRDPFIAIHHG